MKIYILYFNAFLKKPISLSSKWVLVPFLFILHFSVLAQNPSYPNAANSGFDLKRTLPTSPEAAQLGRFGEIPISLYTGTANISIPLYTIQSGGINIPLTLSYHSSGIKVEDESTWVGLGWSMDPGGAIIKVINGKEDSYETNINNSKEGYSYLFKRSVTGVFSQTASIGNTTWDNCASPSSSFPPAIGDNLELFNALVQGDRQPDIYIYNFLGYSGKFYINPDTHKVILIDKKDSLNFKAGEGSSWIVTANSGTKYYFAAVETAHNSTPDLAGITWKLSKIIDYSGKEISFSYREGGLMGRNYSETYHDPYTIVATPITETGVIWRGDYTSSSTKTLTQILTDQVVVKLELEDRQDIGASVDNDTTQAPRRLKSILVVDRKTNKNIKSYRFYYSNIQASQIGGSYLAKFRAPSPYESIRLRLDSLKEIGYTMSGQVQSQPSYQFNYDDSESLPAKTSYARDFWGYYNGKENTNPTTADRHILLPDLKYFYYSNFNENGALMPTKTLNAYKGADRTPDLSKITAGMLLSIKYPTGGSTKFQYESNDFTNYNYPDISKVSESVNSILVVDQNNSLNQKSISFTIPRSQTVQFNNYIQAGPPNSNNNFDSLLPSIIKLTTTINGITSTVKQWNLNVDDRASFQTEKAWINEQIRLHADTLYTISVELPDLLGPQNTAMAQAAVRSSFEYFSPSASVDVVTKGGGVRIAKVTNQEPNGKMISGKIYKYVNTDGTSSGILMAPLNFAHYRYMYEILRRGETQGLWFDFMGPIWYVSSQSYLPYSDGASGNPVGYSRVEELDVDVNGNSKGKTVFVYHNNESKTKVNNPEIPDLANGQITDEISINGIGDTLKVVKYYYQDLNKLTVNPMGNSFTGVKVFNNFLGGDPCNYLTGNGNESLNKYQVDFYPINSAWYKVYYKITKDYFANKVAKQSTWFNYNVLGQLVKDSTVNSKQQVVVNSFIYPVDVTNGRTSIQQSLVDSNYFENLLEQRSMVNSKETSYTKLSYGIINNQLVRTAIDRSNNQYPLYRDVSFVQYGNNKTLTQANLKGVAPYTFLWDKTNSNIICQIKNASLEDVAYTSFENDDTRGWNYINTGSFDITAKTGTATFDLRWSSIKASGLTPTKSYIVSYWSQGGAYAVNGSSYVQGATVNGWTYFEHTLTGKSAVEVVGNGRIDELRLYPSDAQVTTYTYLPLVGMTSMTDAKGQTTTYEYDSFQRLKNVKDSKGNIIKQTDYHYQNQ